MNVAEHGGMLLRFHWPSSNVNLNFYMSELGDPKFQQLLAGMNRWHGTPVLMEPNLRTARLSAPPEKENTDAN